MTNEEINEAACRLAGLKSILGHEFAFDPKCPERGWCLRCFKPRAEHLFPPVSTSWEAAGRLMDALSAKGIFHRLEYDFTRRHGERYYSTVDFEKAKSDSGPMALALAVVALAESHSPERHTTVPSS